MEQRDAQEDEGRSDRLWEVSGFPEYKRQGKSWEERAGPQGDDGSRASAAAG